ncbi:ABC transporter ATP-binding protein [Acidicapsa dinghuensis]|uniref:ABC transporter ATP-binding protein n=1 Tax=Acidicapsa dinghuensis TaxID=2218256 RepID=A0ABW1EE10_9BACT|nr:ATP-binding cassette domain-containing protein [Acidicapsa dinghuensis]
MHAMENEAQFKEVSGENSAPAIIVSNLVKSFGPQRVLDGISFEVRRGETLAILGRSGTGKSVTLRILVGLEPPDEGNASVLGVDMNGASAREIDDARKQMGFLFQHAALYDSLTVAENVAFPLVHHRRDLNAQQRTDRVHELLAEVGLEGHGKKMPSDISGGMQKRVGLARALALDPVVLLLDEPTAGLDPISSAEIDQLVMKLQKEYNLASIVVTHDMVSARTIATRIALMDEGKIVIEGSYEELQQSKERIVMEFLQRDLEQV